jgi:hypothetical protein
MGVDGQLVDKGKRFSLRLPVSFDHPECHKGYYGRFRRSGAAGDFFFAVHTAPSVLRLPAEPNLHLCGRVIASLTLSARQGCSTGFWSAPVNWQVSGCDPSVLGRSESG